MREEGGGGEKIRRHNDETSILSRFQIRAKLDDFATGVIFSTPREQEGGKKNCKYFVIETLNNLVLCNFTWKTNNIPANRSSPFFKGIEREK